MSFQIDSHYQAPINSLWQGRSDSAENERIFQVIKNIDLHSQTIDSLEKGLIIIGFASDEGVKRNLGRTGAKEGPNSIRLQLGKLPYFNELKLYDVGNIQCLNNDLEYAQIALGKLIAYCHKLGHKTLILGGGHETAWGHYLGLKDRYPDLGIVNFDAHFDLRDLNISTSGTPFMQIAKDKKILNQSFDYFCYGTQQTANTKSLFETANSLDVHYLSQNKINQTTLDWQLNYVEDFIDQKNSIYLTICMDVFNASVAPGVSAPQPMGIMPSQLMPVLQYILNSKKVVSADLVELSPKYDKDDITARLASSLAAEIIFNSKELSNE